MWNPFRNKKLEEDNEKLQRSLIQVTNMLEAEKEKEAERVAEEDAILAEETRLETLAQEEIARKSAAKDLATKNGESYITITEISTNDHNITEGNFEFDWNIFFIEELQKNGYVGTSDEDTVEQWFRDICKHVVLETYEQSTSDIGEPNTEDLGDGRKSYS